jgi:hypothetical protein
MTERRQDGRRVPDFGGREDPIRVWSPLSTILREAAKRFLEPRFQKIFLQDISNDRIEEAGDD